MLTSQGAARNERLGLNLACLLAAIAGALNAAAFSVGFFSANMTGNVSALSDVLGTGEWASIIFFLAIILVFIAGSTVSCLMINAGRLRGMAAIDACPILVEAVLLACLGLADLWDCGNRMRFAPRPWPCSSKGHSECHRHPDIGNPHAHDAYFGNGNRYRD